MRYALPSPYRDVPHTSDVGIEAEGATAEEAVARAVLAMGQLLSGGRPVELAETRTAAAAADDASSLLVDILRKTLTPFFTDRLIPIAVETKRLTETSWEGAVAFARYDPERHQGADIKAVTYARAFLGREGDRYVARAVFDI